ncbi:MAG: ribonuclease III [Alphaproteobacteria bacterium]|nr:ribonuclease III [Alphaproteobacteria bacterium]
MPRLQGILGHDFANPDLLTEALTHASAAPRGKQRAKPGRKAASAARGYERLEFLGDRVLGLVIAELLWRRFPDEAEGALTRRHTQLVRREALAEVAKAIDLAPAIIMSAGEHGAGTRDIPGILADVCEAVIAALYLDGGLAAASSFIHRQWERLIEADLTPPRDPKTTLQEWAQARGRKLPHYETLRVDGPPHDRRFTIAVTVDGLAPESAAGSSKRSAEVSAAAALLARIAAGEGQ